MKKLLVVAVVALLVLALVACGGDDKPAKTTAATTTAAAPTTTTVGGDVTTAAPDVTTGTPDVTTGTPDVTTAAPDVTTGTPDVTTGTPDVTTATPDVTTGETPVTTTPNTTVGNGDDTTPDTTVADTAPIEPDTGDAIDLIWDTDYAAINEMGTAFFSFEDFHASLDNHVALVISMNDIGGVYSELFIIDPENPNNNTNWEANTDFSWVVTIEGKEIAIERFSLFNNGTSGWVRIDLGADFKWSNYPYEDGFYTYEQVRIDIYDDEKNLMYFADLTDDDLYGGFVHEKPAEIVMVPDANRNPNLTLVDNKTQATAISGPDDGRSEGYKQFFDGKIQTKICTDANGEENAAIVKYDRVINVAGFSIVNANDNASATGRTVLAFDLYGSADGETWTLIYSADGLDADGNALDKGSVSANYLERFYALDATASYQYFKFVANNGEMWQASELYFYEEA